MTSSHDNDKTVEGAPNVVPLNSWRARAGGGGDGGDDPSTSPPANRPLICVDPGRLPEAIRQSIDALRAHGQVYRRDRLLVVADRSVKRMTRYGEKNHLTLVALNKGGLRLALARGAVFYRTTAAGKPRTADPSDALCDALLDFHNNEPMSLPALRGVSRAPFMRPDGTVCTEPGYDAATGVIFDPGDTVFPPMPPITPHNARELAEAAWLRLIRPLRGYRYDTSEWDDSRGDWAWWKDMGRTVAGSAFMTRLTVYATPTRPMYLSDAAAYGSGKTMQAELPEIMATGDDPPLLNLATETRNSVEEVEKQLSMMFLAGTGHIVCDNARGDLGRYGTLVTLGTAHRLAVRIFKTQNKVEVDNTFMVSISGNNCETPIEIGRRFVRARIDTGVERPDRKQFDFDPRDEVMTERAQMCIDALTVMKAYQVAGAPQPGRAFGSYEEWTRLVRDPLLWLGLPYIATSNDEDSESDDDEKAQLRTFITRWAGAIGAAHSEDYMQTPEGAKSPVPTGGRAPLHYLPEPGTPHGLSLPLSAEEFIAEVDKLEGIGGPAWPLRAAALEVAADQREPLKINSRRLGWFFKRVRGKHVDGYKIHRTGGEGNRIYQLYEVPKG
jgi:hypothetical protein